MRYRNLLLILCALFLLLPSTNVLAKMVSIKGDDINMRSGPSTKSTVLWVLGKGFPLRVLKQSGSWLRVEDFEGTVGWVHTMVTTRTPHLIVRKHKNSSQRINIRKGPGTNNPIVAKAHYGVVFRTLEQKRGWAKIKHEPTGTVGWVKRTLLWGF